MYRELALRGFGVDRGPYSRKERSFPIATLPASVVERLARSLRSQSMPQPLAQVRTARRLTLLLVPLALVALLGLFGLSTGKILSPAWEDAHPIASLCAFASCAFVFVGATLFSLRARKRARLPEGTYLLPLDLITVARDAVIVRPLGTLRIAETKEGAQASDLRLTFADGVVQAFAFSSRHGAAEVFAELENAQERLVELTDSQNLETLTTFDPLHSLRAESSWMQDAPEPTNRTGLRSASAVLGVALAAMLTVGAHRTHAERRDDADYKAAFDAPGTTALEAYLRKTTRRHHDRAATLAIEERKRAVEQAIEQKRLDEEFAAHAERDSIRTTPTHMLSQALQQEEAKLIEAGNALYAKRAAADTKVRAFVQGSLETGRKTGHRTISVKFAKLEGKLGSTCTDRSTPEQLEWMQARIVQALNVALMQVYSSLVLQFEQVPGTPEIVDGVLVAARAHDGGGAIAFDTRVSELRALTPGGPVRQFEPVANFSLTVPVRAGATMRPGTLFKADGFTCVDPSLARVYDRLYDALYELFFSGPIQVPQRYLGKAP
jgi:hypothetical protein